MLRQSPVHIRWNLIVFLWLACPPHLRLAARDQPDYLAQSHRRKTNGGGMEKSIFSVLYSLCFQAAETPTTGAGCSISSGLSGNSNMPFAVI
jgi:hypothetical protein